MLPVFANFAGITLAILLPKPASITTIVPMETKKAGFSKSQHTRFLSVGCLEVAGNVTGVLGLIFAGSGVFQVVYSSVVLFTALLSRVLLGKSPQPKQWLALFLITLGLAVSAIGGTSTPSSTPSAENSDLSRSILIGILFTLVSATFYSFSYVLVEYTLQDPLNAPSERDLQAYAGLYGLILVSGYMIFYTVPNWETLVVQSVAAKHGSMNHVFLAYATLSISCFLHSVSYYKLVRNVGAVSTGVLQALRAVSVFGISSLVICGQHPEQCVTKPKMLSMAVVSIGLYAYSAWSLPKKAVPPEPESRTVSA